VDTAARLNMAVQIATTPSLEGLIAGDDRSCSHMTEEVDQASLWQARAGLAVAAVAALLLAAPVVLAVATLVDPHAAARAAASAFSLATISSLAAAARVAAAVILPLALARRAGA
jgi:hypothetical protein